MAEHPPLTIECYADPSYGENGYLIWSTHTREAWIVDPGFPPADRFFFERANRLDLTPQAIVLTHGHLDHIAGVAPLRALLPEIAIWCPRGEAHLLSDPAENLSLHLGIRVTAPTPTRLLQPGDTLELDDTTWEVRDVAGHSPGGLAYYCPAAGIVLSGDALFADSIGRYDFPHSDRRRLLTNIQQNLLTLPDDTVVYSGHGPAATIGEIKRRNQVLRAELAG